MKILSKIFNLFVRSKPVSDVFGLDRGSPIDRFYIEFFLEKYKKYITGNVLEIADNTYTKKFGQDRNINSFILDYSGANNSRNIINLDLINTDSVPENKFDCIICTQTLNFIFDFNKAIDSLHKMLKINGTALVTVAGISQVSKYDADRWGDFWRFNPMGIEKCFINKFGKSNVVACVYGNNYSATMFLNGFCFEECNKNKLLYSDKNYPLIIAIKITKK
jgi:SAM-dependent methyltransferase